MTCGFQTRILGQAHRPPSLGAIPSRSRRSANGVIVVRKRTGAPDRSISSDMLLTGGDRPYKDRPYKMEKSMWQTRHSMGDGVRPLVNHPVRGVDNSYSGGHRPRGGSFSFPFPIA